MALFSRLLKLNTGSIPLEDFFTELVAYLFSTNKGILYAWLKHSSLLDSSTYLDAHVSTQRAFEPLDWHLSGSRPDVLIEIGDDISRDIIFIESKIGSQEGINQLKNYAEILHELPNFRNKLLVYITRDFEPKNKAAIFQKIPGSNVQFRQLRWHQFYQFLKSQANTTLVQEIIAFMQEYDMAHNNQFSSVDVITLANFTKSLKLMDQIIWGGVVSQRFKEVLGAIMRPSLTEVQKYDRYLIRTWMQKELWCGLGFHLQTSSLTDYPKVFLRLDVPPQCPHRAEIVGAMIDICEQYGWRSHDLGDSRAWAGIIRDKSLQDFLSEQDHVVAIEAFFLESLDELEKIKRQYSSLPWGAIANDGASLDDLLPDDLLSDS